jgi:hypothetical protein
MGVAAMALMGASRDASAESTAEERALAATLFRDARALLEANRVSEACRKLEASERLYPAGGTLLNLAVCHEREGRTASAWTEFREARAMAERDGRADRAELASEHARALEGKLSRLSIVVPREADAPDVAVALDGHALARAAWGTQIPVDPGTHVVAATARGKRPWSTPITVRPEQPLETITLPRWQEEPAAAQTPPGPTPAADANGERSSPAQAASDAPAAASRAPLVIAAAVGIGGIGVGSYFGALALSRHAQVNNACTTPTCLQAATGANDSSKSVADASTVAFAVGLVGLAATAYLWFSRDPGASAPRTAIAPSVGPGRGSLDVTGRF